MPEQAQEKVKRAPSPEQVWVALARAYRAVSASVERQVADSGLVLTDFMLLEALLHKGPMTITEVQESALLATGSMTAAVDRLERKGLLERQSSERDRRARVLVLTAEGQERIRAAYADHRTQLREWMGVLSPAERASTFAALRKLEQHQSASATQA